MSNQIRPILLVTVDTEEEWNWEGQFPQPPFSTENIKSIPNFQSFCSDLGITPTYFIDHAVAELPENQEILFHYFSRKECDIGAHLHPWCTPPVTEEISEANSHAVNLPIELVSQKMTVLTKLLENVFKCHPFSFRSGRWGMNGAFLQILADLGYKVDSSVRPFYNDQFFNYSNAMTSPYWPAFDNLLNQGLQRDILEIPASSGYNRPDYEVMDKWHTRLAREPIRQLRLIGILSRIRLMQKITLTPEAQSTNELQQFIDAHMKRGDKVLNLFFHSSDLLPGKTMYVRNQNELQQFYKKIENCVEYSRTKYDAEVLTVRQAYHRLTGCT